MKRFVLIIAGAPVAYLAISGAQELGRTISIDGIAPDPWAALMTLILIAGRSNWRWTWGAPLGLLSDLQGLPRFGIAIATYLGLAYATTTVLGGLRRPAWWMQLISALALTIMLIGAPAILRLPFESFAGLSDVLMDIAWTSVYTTALTIPPMLIHAWWRECVRFQPSTFVAYTT